MKCEKIMKMTYVIISNDTVIGKVYEHPMMGRTICFNGTVEIDGSIQVWKVEEGGIYNKVQDKLVLELFRDMLPL